MKPLLLFSGIIFAIIGIFALIFQDTMESMITGMFFQQLEESMPSESGKETIREMWNSFDMVGPFVLFFGIIQLIIGIKFD